MSDAAPPCDHPADAPVLDPSAIATLRCHAHYCPRCREWLRMSDDLPHHPRPVSHPAADAA